MLDSPGGPTRPATPPVPGWGPGSGGKAQNKRDRDRRSQQSTMARASDAEPHGSALGDRKSIRGPEAAKAARLARPTATGGRRPSTLRPGGDPGRKGRVPVPSDLVPPDQGHAPPFASPGRAGAARTRRTPERMVVTHAEVVSTQNSQGKRLVTPSILVSRTRWNVVSSGGPSRSHPSSPDRANPRPRDRKKVKSKEKAGANSG
jgi:hypothetical protein